MKPVKHISVSKGISAAGLVDEMGKSGVMGAGRVAKASQIMAEMLGDRNCNVFFGLAGAMVPGGMKQIIVDILKTGRISAFVTTGATLTHDLIEAIGYSHYQGSADADDKMLNKKGIDRIYNSFMENKVYVGLEAFFKKYYDRLAQHKKICDFLWEIGSFIPAGKRKNSILGTCYDMKIPLFCPAIADSGIGLMMWGNIAKGKSCSVLAFEDMKDIINLAWSTDSKKNGIIYVGGGVPKNYIQQALQFSKGASYGVQMTADLPQWGGSSGAELREGISWGKMNSKAKFIDVYGDATITLPLVWAAVKQKLK